MKAIRSKKRFKAKRIELEVKLMDLIEGSQDLEGISALFFDVEIISILEELERLEGI